jgi:hypothetical protein
MPASLSTCALDRTTGPDSLLRLFAWNHPWNLCSWILVLCSIALIGWTGPILKGWNLFPVLCVFLYVGSYRRIFLLIQSSRWLLPLGDRRTATYLWLCEVLLVPFQAILACAPLYLGGSEPGVHSFLNYAQRGLWVAGILAILSTCRSLAGNAYTEVIRFVVLCIPFVVCLPNSSVSSVIASGRNDLTLNVLSAVMLVLSFWALRFKGREDIVLSAPLAEQAALRDLELHGGWAARVMSVFSEGIRADRLSGHWLSQLVYGVFLSSACMSLWILLLHYGFAQNSPVKPPFSSSAILLLLVLPCLARLNPRVLRRLPLGASAITALTVVLIIFTAVICTLPPLAFERVPGSFSVRFTPSQVFSLNALGTLFAGAGQMMLGWILFMSSSSARGAFGIMSWMAVVVILSIPGGLLAGLQSDWGSRAGLVIGGGLLFGGAIVYDQMLRRSLILYKPTNNEVRLPWME